MNIIERYKKEADRSVQEYMKNLQQNEDEEHESFQDNANGRQFIEEIHPTDEHEQILQSRENYEEKQFQFFATKTKNKQSKCIVCKKDNPKYKCPKCNVKYCSTEHYRSHNLFCTQKFFQEQVQVKLKATKANKEDKKKMIQTLKANQQQIAKDQSDLSNQTKVEPISEKRLQELIQLLEKDQQIHFSENQMKQFQTYLKEIQYASMQNEGLFTEEKEANQHKEDLNPFEQYTPFWLIKEGLSQYFLIGQSMQIQQYNKSLHKEIIDYRQLASNLLREDTSKLLENINFKKTSIFVNFELIQIIYLSALLFRSFNGQYLKNIQFSSTFIEIYDELLAKKMSQFTQQKVINSVNSSITVFGAIKTNIANLSNKSKQLLSILQSWMKLILFDCQTIFSNKYLCLQTLLRLMECFKSISTQFDVKWSDEVMKSQKKQKVRNSKQNKQRDAKLFKLIKKLEFLLCYAIEVVYREPVDRNEEVKAQSIKAYNNKLLILNAIKSEVECEKKVESQVKNLQQQKEKQKQRTLHSILIP